MRIALPKGARNLYGPAIRRAREQSRLGMTQTDLADTLTEMGLTLDRSAVSRIENQQRSLTDIELRFIVEALRINIQKLDQLLIQNRNRIPAYEDFRIDDDDSDFLEIRVAEDPWDPDEATD